MRILYFAKDAPQVNSGYGKCCREICLGLKKSGFEVFIAATVGNRCSPVYRYEGIEILPSLEDAFAEDVILNHYHYVNADVLITQFDIWPLAHIYRYAMEGKINWIPYAPLDYYPIPQSVHHKLRHGLTVLTMCDWANQELTKLGFDCTTIHHGINKNIYRFLNKKKELKKEIGFEEDCFLIGMVQANQLYRKAWEEQLQAVSIFMNSHPEMKIRLYIHSLPHTEQGYDLTVLLRENGIAHKTIICDDYKWIMGFSEENMARLYNAFDILLSCTNGEGFGLPVIEAQGCGVPVIGTDVMSFPELIKFGALVRVKGWFRSPNGLVKAVPDTEDIAKQLYNVSRTKWNAVEIQNTAHYLWDWDETIIPKWVLMLASIQEKIERSCTSIPKPSKHLEMLSKEFIIEDSLGTRL